MTTSSTRPTRQQQQRTSVSWFRGCPKDKTRIIALGLLAVLAFAAVLRINNLHRDRNTGVVADRSVWYDQKGSYYWRQWPRSSSPVVVPVNATDEIYWKHGTMSPIVLERYKLVFFHVPKVACTSFKLLFYRLLGYEAKKPERGWKAMHSPRSNKLNYLFEYGTSYATAMMNNPEWTRAVFVRDPHERLLSAFLNKGPDTGYALLRAFCCPRLGPAGNRMYEPSCLSPPAKVASSHSQYGEDDVRLFKEFVALLDSGRCTDNRHWKKQSERVDDKFWPVINFVGHMDTLQQDTEALLIRIGALTPDIKDWLASTTMATAPDPSADGEWYDDDKEFVPEAGPSPNAVASAASDRDGRYDDQYDDDEDNGGGRHHATNASVRMRQFFADPELFDRVTALYRKDFEHPLLGLSVTKPDWLSS